MRSISCSLRLLVALLAIKPLQIFCIFKAADKVRPCTLSSSPSPSTETLIYTRVLKKSWRKSVKKRTIYLTNLKLCIFYLKTSCSSVPAPVDLVFSFILRISFINWARSLPCLALSWVCRIKIACCSVIGRFSSTLNLIEPIKRCGFNGYFWYLISEPQLI